MEEDRTHFGDCLFGCPDESTSRTKVRGASAGLYALGEDEPFVELTGSSCNLQCRGIPGLNCGKGEKVARKFHI